MLHNFEEILTIEKWFKNTFPTIRNQIPTLVKKELEKEEKITSGQFSIAVCVLFIISSVLILLTVIQGYYFLFIGLNIFFTLNIFTRSEEHTSELQSRGHLVFRLLLDKKIMIFRT